MRIPLVKPTGLALDARGPQIRLSGGAQMRRRVIAALLLMLSIPLSARGETLPAVFPFPYDPGSINSGAFGIRGPMPGSPPFLATVKYIDDGMRYVDPLSRFFISPIGEMCFLTIPDYPTIIYDHFYRTWCIHPLTVDRVEAVTNPATNEVRVWCMRAYPQCAHSLGEFVRFSNNISAPTLDYRQERAALENLVYMMGGYVRFQDPVGLASPGEFR